MVSTYEDVEIVFVVLFVAAIGVVVLRSAVAHSRRRVSERTRRILKASQSPDAGGDAAS